MKNIDYFRFELDQIKHQSIRDLVTRVLWEKVPDHFLEVPASTSNYYSSTKTGEAIKLSERTKSSVRIFLIMVSNPLIKMQFTDIQRDYIIAALILHDTFMRGNTDTPTPVAVFEHPLLVPYLQPNNMNQVEAGHFNEICRLISSHHGPWRTSDKSQYQLAEVTDNMQFYVHLCDYLASKPMVWVDTSDHHDVTKRFL